MADTNYNLEDEYGDFLDLVDQNISELSDDDTDESLAHHGVLGMHWGTRKTEASNTLVLKSLGPDKIIRKTASGETLTLTKDPTTRLHQFLSKHKKGYTELYQNSASLTIHDGTGKRIGEAQLAKVSADEINLVWLGINHSARGKGYATAVMKAAAEFGRQSGVKKLTLEVPGNSPDARHIYEKLGFKSTGVILGEKGDAWDGLTKMVYNIDTAKHSAAADDILSHHGILGMHWGTRKPAVTSTPHQSKAVSSETKAKRVAQAAVYSKRAQTYRTQITQINKKQNQNIFQRRSNRSQVKELTKLRDQAVKIAEAKKNGKLTPDEKALVIGAAAVGLFIAAKVTRTHIEGGTFARIATKGMTLINGQEFSFAKKAALADAHMTIEDIQKHVVDPINPNYGLMGTKMNCRRATFAYEMRRRGYDVVATKTTQATGQNVQGLVNALSPDVKYKSTDLGPMLMQMYKEHGATVKYGDRAVTPLKTMGATISPGAKVKIESILPGAKFEITESESIFEALAKEPTGSRGELGVVWQGGGGHSMAYEIFNGKPVIIDNQSGVMYHSAEEFTSPVSTAGYTRLDNIPLNHDYLAKWVKNAK